MPTINQTTYVVNPALPNSSFSACFDGTYIWTISDGYLCRFVAATGAGAGTFNIPSINTTPFHNNAGGFVVYYDGTYIWTANTSDGSLGKFNPVTGANIATYDMGISGGPSCMVSDGTNLWVGIYGASIYHTRLYKINPSTGAIITFYVLDSLFGKGTSSITFDGTNLWCVNDNGVLYKVLASTGAVIGSHFFPTSATVGVYFDGVNIWVPSRDIIGFSPVTYQNNLYKFTASTFTLVGTYAFGSTYLSSYPTGLPSTGEYWLGLTSDGTNVWVIDAWTNGVYVFNKGSGTLVAQTTIPPVANILNLWWGSVPCYDGTAIWIATEQPLAGQKITQTLDCQVAVEISGSSSFGKQVDSLFFGGGNVWAVVGQNSGGTGGGWVVQVNPIVGTTTNVPIQSWTAPASALGGCFDGTSLWVNGAGSGGNCQAFKIRPSDGTLLQTVNYPSTKNSIYSLYAAPYVYFVNTVDGTLTQILASTGAVNGTYTITGSSAPAGIAFDGTNIWIIDSAVNKVFVMSPAGAVLNTFTIGSGLSLAFDGTNIWIGNYAANTLTKMNLSGTVLGTFAVNLPSCLAFDGTYIWVATYNSTATLRKLSVFTLSGSLLDSISNVFEPIYSMAWDGASMWTQAFGANFIFRYILASASLTRMTLSVPEACDPTVIKAPSNAVNIKAPVSTIIPAGTKSPLRLVAPQQLRNSTALPTALGTSLAQDLNNIQQTVNAIHTAAQQSPQVQQILITNTSGTVIAAIGNLTYEGVLWVNYLSELHVANPQNPADPTGAIFNANVDGSVTIGGNGWVAVHDEFDADAAWIGTQNETLTITNAVNNGAGLIRLIVPGHTLATGNSATVRNMNLANVLNANGTWTVTVIDANTVDLQGSIWSGPFQPIVQTVGLPTSEATIDRVLQIAGITNAGGLFRVETTIAHGYESGTKVDVQFPGPVGNPNAVGQWIISFPATLAVSSAVDNGSGLIRLTIPNGNYQTGDKVEVLAVGGVPNASGRWIATAISASVIDLQGSLFSGTYTSGGTATFTNPNFFDLVGSTFAGSYISGGTVLQYFAGILAETIAIGPSFQNYKLRAFPSGDLRIRNAEITLTSAFGEIVIDPTATQIRLTNFTNLSEIVLDATIPSLTFFDQTGTPDVTLEILQETALPVSSATNASPIVMHVVGSATGSVLNGPWVNGDTIFISGATGNTIINGYRIIENFNAAAETFNITDLQGDTLNGNGAYAGAATAARYYAGLLAQTLALGGSWGGYRLRFFADGTLKINRASIDASTITNSTIAGSSLTSTSGTPPNVLTLTINNGALTVSGTGTEAGKGIITMDQLALTGQTPAPTDPSAGTAILYYDTGTAALTYNLGGTGWFPIKVAKSYDAPFTAVAGTPLLITHSLATKTVIVQAYDSSDNAVAYSALNLTSTNSLTITFGISFTGRIVVLGT